MRAQASHVSFFFQYHRKNGKDLGHAADIPSHLHQTALFPCCTLKNAELKFNFGQTALSALPDGFTALASLPPGSSVDASGAFAIKTT